MAKDNQRRAGRRPRRATPMARSAFTAFAEHHIFLLLLSGRGEMSDGVRRAIDRLVELDDEAEDAMAQAKKLVELAKAELGEDASQHDVVTRIKDDWLRFSGSA